MRFSIELPHSVIKAANVESLRGRARDRGIADFACELGHGKGTRRFIWHLHCSIDVAQLLIEDLDRLRASAEHLAVRNECASVVAILRDAIERPPEQGEFHTRIVYTVTKPSCAIDQRMRAASEYGALPVGPSAAPRSEKDPFRFTVTQRVDVGDLHFRVARLALGKADRREVRWAVIDQHGQRYAGPRAPTPLEPTELKRLIRHWWMLRTSTVDDRPPSPRVTPA